MATTRLESGQVRIDSAGAVPMQRIDMEAVDYTIAAKEKARLNQTYEKIVSNLSEKVFNYADTLVDREAQEYLVQNPVTGKLLNEVRSGVLVNLGGGIGTISGDLLPSRFNAAVRKGRSVELSAVFTNEFSSLAAKLLQDLEDNKTNVESVQTQLNDSLNGFRKSLASVDGDAATTFAANAALRGNTVITKGYEIAAKKAKQDRQTLSERGILDDIALIRPLIEVGDFSTVLTSGEVYQEVSVAQKLEAIKDSITNHALVFGDLASQQKFLKLFTDKVNEVNQDILVKYFTDPKIQEGKTTKDILEGLDKNNAGKYSSILQGLDANSKAAVTASILVYRNNKIQAAKEESEKNNEEQYKKLIGFVIEFNKQKKTDPGRKLIGDEIANIVRQYPRLISIEQIQNIMRPVESNPVTYFFTLRDIYKGTISSDAPIAALINSGELSPEDGSKLLTVLENRKDKEQRDLSRQLAMIAGIDFDDNDIGVINTKPLAYQRYQALEKKAENMKAEAKNKGESLSNFQLLKELNADIDKKLQNKQIREAKESLKNNYGVLEWIQPGKDQAYRSNNPFDITPQKYRYLQDLVDKEKDERKKKQMQQQLNKIKDLLIIAYPGEM